MNTAVAITTLLTLTLGGVLADSEKTESGAFAGQRADDGNRPERVLLTDFTNPESNQRWRPRNDDVMGGRSPGKLSITESRASPTEPEGVLTMSGSINLNGGGFTSVMMDLGKRGDGDGQALPEFAGMRGVRMRVRASGEPFHRPFRLRVEDSVGRREGVNFRGLITLSPTGDPNRWQTATVWFQHLRPTIRGREVDPADWAPLDVSKIRRLGVILNDTAGGPYRFEIDRIELVR